MEKILTIKERILLFLDENRIKKSDFYEAAGIEPSNFKGRNRLSQPGGEMLVKILTAYPNLSAEWLLTGRGEMLKTNGARQDILSDKDNEGAPSPQASPQIISELLTKISDQAEEIGRLKAHIDDLQRRRGDNAGHAQSSAAALTG